MNFNRITNWVLSHVVSSFLERLTDKELKALLDKLIDMLEEFVQSTENKMDDQLIPVLKKIRDILQISDND